MATMKDAGIRGNYSGKGEGILRNFLLPLLDTAVRYDRITSFYTTDSLLGISQGVYKLYERGGKMRLIVGMHSIPTDIVDASLRRDYLINQVNEIRSDITSGLNSLKDALQKKRVATLAWMMEDGLLEVRAAAVSGSGIFHAKTFILEDEDGNAVAAIGSSNETNSGLGNNYEQIFALKSWQSPEDVAEQKEFFESLWRDDDDDVTVCEITEEVAAAINSALGADYPNPHKAKQKVESTGGVISNAAKMPANYFVSGTIPALFQHQERAVIDALSRWPVRVLFADEVGLGKTFEAAATMAFLVKYCSVKRVIILTPKAVLMQWQEELNTHFGIAAGVFDSSSRSYVMPDGTRKYIGKRNPIGNSAPNIMLLSVQFARGSAGGKNIFERKGAIYPDLLVVDEAHSARVSVGISGEKKATKVYKMLSEVSRRIPHVILATATPMQKDASEYHALLKILGLPKKWQRDHQYKVSLNLISTDAIPNMSDANAAGSLLRSTIAAMNPSLDRLDGEERSALTGLMSMGDECGPYETADYVQNNWSVLRGVFVKLHPAHLLTVRNTRKALVEMGYVFPKRNLEEVSLGGSTDIQLFYSDVNEYIRNTFFSVERELYPDRKLSTGFVQVSYQQRVASSIYSCRESLRRRLERMLSLKGRLSVGISNDDPFLKELGYASGTDDIASDDLLSSDDYGIEDYPISTEKVDQRKLATAIDLELTSIQPLIDGANKLLSTRRDKKIVKSIELAIARMEKGDAVLLFSRYTDTVAALVDEFAKTDVSRRTPYGIYTGQQSVVVRGDSQEPCDKREIKRRLSSGDLKLMICSDAASEGLNLQAARVLINVDVPWTPARLEQRIGRIARLGQQAAQVDVYNIWYPDSIEAKMYHRIQKRLEESNLAIGEFPEVVADSIRDSVLAGSEQDDDSAQVLQEIRNSTQTEALGELWSYHDRKVTTSNLMRKRLMEICEDKLQHTEASPVDGVRVFDLPDGSKVALSDREGLEECVSLTSKPWCELDFPMGPLGFVRDASDNPAAFVMPDNSGAVIDHESIVDLLSNNPAKTSPVDTWPKMLANPGNLSLTFAVDGEVASAPSLWPPRESE